MTTFPDNRQSTFTIFDDIDLSTVNMQNLRKATLGIQKSRPSPGFAAKDELIPYYVTVILPEKIRLELEYEQHAMFFSDRKAFPTALTGGWGDEQKA